MRKMKPHDYTRLSQDNDNKWLYKDVTERIIGAAMEVQNILGSGFLECVLGLATLLSLAGHQGH